MQQAVREALIVPHGRVRFNHPPSGADWVHEIKHDGYRMIVRRDDPALQPQCK